METAQIWLVGIILVSYQIVPGSLIAVAPKIPCPPPQQLQRKAITRVDEVMTADAAAQNAMAAQGVGEHVAVLLVPVSDFISSSGWPATVLESVKPACLYVRLDGEQIRFVPAKVPEQPASGKRQKADPTGIPTDFGLGHIGCCGQQSLWSGYMPPRYSLAAAVVDLSNGAPQACVQSAVKNDGMARRDTVVTIDNGGTLTIEATKNGTKKSITVAGNAQITIGNIPSSVLPGNSCNNRGALMHNLAYGAMLSGSCANPGACPMLHADAKPCNFTPLGGANRANAHQYDSVVLAPHSDPLYFTDAHCSNTQWP